MIKINNIAHKPVLAATLAVNNNILYKEYREMKEIPIWEKSNLTLEEAAAYSGIGINKLRALSSREDCEFVLWVGTKRLIKRIKLDEYIEKSYSI